MTKPKLTKTHRWNPEQFEKVEDLARRTGRPVQHVLDDAVAIGLEQIEDAIDARMRNMDRWQAWESFVGSQTPEEFWQISRDQGCKTYSEAAERYTRDCPNIFRTEWAEYEGGQFPDLDVIASLLEGCLQENLGPQTWQAWLGDMLLGEGRSRQAAIESAVQEYEAHGGYGEYPLIHSREELVARLSVSPRVEEA